MFKNLTIKLSRKITHTFFIHKTFGKKNDIIIRMTSYNGSLVHYIFAPASPSSGQHIRHSVSVEASARLYMQGEEIPRQAQNGKH